MTEIILTSSVLILLLAALRRLLRGRIHPTVQYALWLLVAARLLIPGSLFTAPVSLMGSAQGVLTAVEDTLAGTTVPSSPLPATPDTPDIPDIPADTVVVVGATASAVSPRPAVNWLRVIWLGGAAAMGGALLLSNLIFYLDLRKKRQRIPVDQLPCPCPLRVYQVPGLASPCLFGLIRPAIYLNSADLSQQELTHILIHEETHFRHGDHLWALLRSLCLTIHWYDPLVWWAAVLSRRDCELSCDAAAIRRLGEDSRIQYGETLLRMVVPGRHPAQLLRTATTMSGGKKAMAERIRLIAQRPRMLKLTLAAVILLAVGGAVFFFGGGEEAPPAEDPPPMEDPADTDSGTAAALTEELAIQRYQLARELWSWFELGTLPTTGETIQSDSGTLTRVANFDSLDALRSHLEQVFSPTLTDYLLTSFMPLHEQDGKLYVLPAGRGSNIYAGEEHVTAFVYTGPEAAQLGADGHLCVRTDVLGEDLTTVLYQTRHDWYLLWNGQNYVFTSFGPGDDVDPQRYYNALTVLDHWESGAPVSDWLPSMPYLDWNAMYAACETRYQSAEKCMEVLDALFRYTAENDLTPAEMQQLLSATEGLDGAYSEEFQLIVYQLYQRAPFIFAYTVTELLSGTYQTRVLDYLRYELSQQEGGNAMTAPEATTLLRQVMTDELSAAPTEATLTCAGDTVRFLPVNAWGSISAVSYRSSDPDVATVDQAGLITAVTPGEATVALHYEGAEGQRDFTCAVTCQWTEEPEEDEAPDESVFLDGEIMNGIMRGFAPFVWDEGSPTDIAITLSDDWTVDGICAALFTAVSERTEGTALEGDLVGILLSPAFQFPETMADGVTMSVPFFACYQQEPTTLPSGESFTPACQGPEVTAQVTLVGSGITAPVDEDFAQQQADYQLLKSCVPIAGGIQVSVAETDFDLTIHIRETVAAQLESTGLADRYQIAAISTGGYVIPTQAAVGYEQTVHYDISFSSIDGSGFAVPLAIDGEVLVTTTE